MEQMSFQEVFEKFIERFGRPPEVHEIFEWWKNPKLLSELELNDHVDETVIE